jgi:hypothetical protein
VNLKLLVSQALEIEILRRSIEARSQHHPPMKTVMTSYFALGMLFASAWTVGAQSLEGVTKESIPIGAVRFEGKIEKIDVDFFANGDPIALKEDQVPRFVGEKRLEWVKHRSEAAAPDDVFSDELALETVPVFLVAVLTYRIEGKDVPAEFKAYRRAIGIASGAELDVALSERGIAMEFCGNVSPGNGGAKILRLQKFVTIGP